MSLHEIATSTKVAWTVAGGTLIVTLDPLWEFLGLLWSYLPTTESYAEFAGGTLALMTVIYRIIDRQQKRGERDYREKVDDEYRDRLRKVEERESFLEVEYRSGRHVGHEILTKPLTRKSPFEPEDT